MSAVGSSGFPIAEPCDPPAFTGSLPQWLTEEAPIAPLPQEHGEARESLQAFAARLRAMPPPSDPVTRFVYEQCEIQPEAITPVSELFGAYRTWRLAHATMWVTTIEAFGRYLRIACPAVHKARLRRYGRASVYCGIKLKSTNVVNK